MKHHEPRLFRNEINTRRCFQCVHCAAIALRDAVDTQ
jgi:hypothetical protein